MKTITTTTKSADFIAEDLPLVEYGDNQFQTAKPMSLKQLCSAMTFLLAKQFERESALTSPDMTIPKQPQDAEINT